MKFSSNNSIAFGFFFIYSFAFNSYYAQNVGINATNSIPDASAMLDVSSTNKGLLIPRVALTGTTDVATITTATTSLLVYNTATATDVTPGYYYWDGATWLRMLEGGTNDFWKTTGNAGTTVGTNFLGTTDAQDFAIYTNNTEKIRVDQAGNVGIGTTTPSARLHALLTDNASATHILGITRQGTGAAGNGIFFTHGTSLSDYNAITDAGDIGMFFDIDGNPAVSTSTNGLVIAPWANGGTPGYGTGIKIQENGNVGIGTTLPNYHLEVSGNSEPETRISLNNVGPISNNNGMDIMFNSNGNILGRIRAVTLANSNNDGEISFYTRNANVVSQKMVIKNTGNVGIFTSVPTAKLSVNGGANKPGGGAWAVFSDKTLKKDINDFSLGIEILSQLHLVNFKYNDKYFDLFGKNKTVRKSTYQGIIAQELQKIAPFMVKEKTVEKTDSTGRITHTEKILEVDPSAFTYMLINATNEQQKIIEAQKTEINDLKERIEAIETLLKK